MNKFICGALLRNIILVQGQQLLGFSFSAMVILVWVCPDENKTGGFPENVGCRSSSVLSLDLLLLFATLLLTMTGLDNVHVLVSTGLCQVPPLPPTRVVDGEFG